jgi:acetylornithine deacetylase/succinyl-diaminopimelate desuccinylase-like protein
MEVNIDRLLLNIEKMAAFNSTLDEGITRLSYSAEDQGVRELLTKKCKDIGMDVAVDAIGNIRARYHGSDSGLPPLLLGSHIDSV